MHPSHFDLSGLLMLTTQAGSEGRGRELVSLSGKWKFSKSEMKIDTIYYSRGGAGRLGWSLSLQCTD